MRRIGRGPAGKRSQPTHKFRRLERGTGSRVVRRQIASGWGTRREGEFSSSEAAMLKKLMISAAVSALLVSGAMAQGAPHEDAKFISSHSADKRVFSKLK